MISKIHRNSLKPGYHLHWYQVKHVLGQGGFGITYLAQDLNLNKEVAIKEYLPIELAIREGDASVHPVTEERNKQYKSGLDSFIREARILAQFDHPNIVKVYSVFEENNTGYMVMNYEHGESLQTKLKGKKTLEESELLKILIPILGGLDLVHKSGFIHRDIKPDNIFIRNDGSPVLIDFGSARQAFSGKTLTSIITPGYAPFEQYDSNLEQQGPWTDIYGLGATLYRSISGRPPSDSIDRSRSLIRSSVDPYVPAIEIGKKNYSMGFLKAIDHALKFKEENRPRNIAEWRKEFDVLSEYLESAEYNVLYPKKKYKTIIALIVAFILFGFTGLFYIYNYNIIKGNNKETIANNDIKKAYKFENKIEGIWTSSYGPLTFQILSDGSYTGTYKYTPWENGYIYGELNKNTFTGYFTEEVMGDEPYEKCNQEYRNSYNWGTLEFIFNEDFTEFNGKWGDCSNKREQPWKGEKN